MTEPTALRPGWLWRANVGDQADHFEKQVEVDALLGGDFDEDGAFAADGPLFGDEAAVGELLLDALGLASGLSILLTATMMGTLAALAWSMASRFGA